MPESTTLTATVSADSSAAHLMPNSVSLSSSVTMTDQAGKLLSDSIAIAQTLALAESAGVAVSVSAAISTALAATITPAYQLAGVSDFGLSLDSSVSSIAQLTATALMPVDVGTELSGAGFGYTDIVALGSTLGMNSAGEYLWQQSGAPGATSWAAVTPPTGTWSNTQQTSQTWNEVEK
jgi:hypothetical protein